MVKLWFCFIVAILMMPVVSGLGMDLPGSLPELVLIIFRELFVGILIGFVGLMLFIGVQFCGQIIGIQMGFGIVNVIDPFAPGQVSVIGEFYYLIAILIFLAVGGHHIVLSALAESYRVIPLGKVVIPAALSAKIIDVSKGVFVVGVKLAAPVMVTLFFMYVALGFISRTVPQMNVFLVGFPLSISIGLAMIALSISFFGAVFLKFLDIVNTDIFTMIRLITP